MRNNQSLKDFYILWSTQSLSQLGSSMTEFALTLWLYEKTGSALSTAALTICTYAPYVVLSIFATASRIRSLNSPFSFSDFKSSVARTACRIFSASVNSRAVLFV